ncbi:hypothetical protein D1007_45709 [Hordeum vulgare]|nr:hypothetical protein D1007_45709 [Hordeum vulgare]
MAGRKRLGTKVSRKSVGKDCTVKWSVGKASTSTLAENRSGKVLPSNSRPGKIQHQCQLKICRERFCRQTVGRERFGGNANRKSVGREPFYAIRKSVNNDLYMGQTIVRGVVYARDPSAAIAAAASTGANPSLASFGLVSAGAPPSTGLARSFFMAARLTSAGRSAPAPTMIRAPISKLPNAPVVKKTIKKVSGNKKKDDEKWRPREGVDEESNERKRTIDLDDDEEESSSDGGKTIPTPNSVPYFKTNSPSGGKNEGK